MDILCFLGLVLMLMAILEIRLYYKNKNGKTTITFKDEGDLHVERALQLLNEARLTAKANKPKS